MGLIALCWKPEGGLVPLVPSVDFDQDGVRQRVDGPSKTRLPV